MDPIKDTQTIKDLITDYSHLVEKVRYLQNGPTNMDPVLTRVGIIGQGGTWTISGVSISQSIYAFTAKESDRKSVVNA